MHEQWKVSLTFNSIRLILILLIYFFIINLLVHCDFNADIIPVDFVANSLLVIGWHTARYADQRQPVIHITSGVKNPVRWGEILNYARMGALRSPSMKLVRPIARNPVSARGLLGKANHLFVKFFSHFVFAFLFDLFLMVTGNPRVMVKVTRKMHRAFDVLEHFTNREWCFRYHAYQRIFAQLSDDEKEQFVSDVERIDWKQYCDTLTLGSRRFLLNEDDSTIEPARRRQRFLSTVYLIFDSTLYLLMFAIALYLGKLMVM